MYICELCGKGFHKFCFPTCPSYVPTEFYYCNPCLTSISAMPSLDPILDFPLLNYLKSKALPSNFTPS